MSHKAPADRPVRVSSCRRVRFQAVLEDLEGRILLSGVRHYKVPQVHVRAVHIRTAPLRLSHPPRVQIRLAHRPPTNNAQSQSPTINIPVNVQTTFVGSTSTSTSMPPASSAQPQAVNTVGISPSTTVTQPTSPTTVQSWPAVVLPSTAPQTVTSSTAGTSTQAIQSSSSTSSPTAQPSNPPATSTTSPSVPASTSTGSATPGTSPSPQPAPPTFPDGTFLVNAQTGEIDQYSGSHRHLISPPVAARMGISSAQLTALTSNTFNQIPAGSDYFPEGMFLRNAQTGEISLYSGGTFHLVSVPVATTMKLTGSNVVTITADQYNRVSKSNDFFPDNILIQNVQTGEVDLYSGGQRHWISVPVFTKMNITMAQITTISAQPIQCGSSRERLLSPEQLSREPGDW